jgi:hypothetical protein
LGGCGAALSEGTHTGPRAVARLHAGQSTLTQSMHQWRPTGPSVSGSTDTEGEPYGE